MGRSVGRRSRKKRNRPPRLDDEQVARLGGGGEYLGGVHFELEEDAEELFLRSLEELDPTKVKKDERELPGKKERTAGRRSRSDIFEIDLHMRRLNEAIQDVDSFIQELTSQLKGEIIIKIITGKGRHSGPDGAVLAVEVHHHVKRKYAAIIHAIEESPADVKVGGLPIRGHFHVRFRKN